VFGLELMSPESWAELKCPVLIMAGMADNVTSVENVDLLSSWISSGNKQVMTIKVPKAGHAIMIENKEIVEDSINRFLVEHVTRELDLSWQLVQLADDKWSLKNEEKVRLTV